MSPLDFFAGDDKQLIAERIGAVFVNGEESAEAGFVCKDGRAIPYFFTSRKVLFDAKPYLIGTGIDISERKAAEEALRLMQVELARISRVTALGELSASIAHEVNQPLAAIIGNADICLSWLSAGSPDLQEVREAISDILNDGNRASEVIKRIRTLVKKGPLQKTRLDINEVVREVIALVTHAATRRRVRLETELGDALPTLMGDRVRLQQVLLNLIVNGMDAMNAIEEDARELVVETGENGSGEVQIAVRDRGIVQ